MKRKEMYLAGSFLLLFGSLLVSCEKDNGTGIPTLSLGDTVMTVSEAVGTVKATITLSEAATSDITISYTLGGTAILNGDYQADTTSPIVIKAGSTSATIQFTVFDDDVLEPSKTIEISYSSTDAVNFNNAKTVITITDNETDLSAQGLKSELTWDAGTLVDLDLYVLNNVVIENDEITDFDIVKGSENEKGFEAVMINNTDADDEYFIAVSYASGTRQVNYSLNYNGPSISNQAVDGDFSPSQAGYAVFYGPITKSGSVYGRAANGSSLFNLKAAKSFIYKVKIK